LWFVCVVVQLCAVFSFSFPFLALRKNAYNDVLKWVADVNHVLVWKESDLILNKNYMKNLFQTVALCILETIAGVAWWEGV
jgi:hypothetical protein